MPPNFDYFNLYANLQAFVKKDATDIANSTYKSEGTQYGVAAVPFHVHNGVDSPQIPWTSVGGVPVFSSVPTKNGQNGQLILVGTIAPYILYAFISGVWVSISGNGAAGSNTDVQFNNSGLLGGDSGLTYDKGDGTYKIFEVADSGSNIFIESFTEPADSSGSAHKENDLYRTLPLTAGSGNATLLDGFTELRTTSATPVTPSTQTFGAIVGGGALVEARFVGVQTGGSGTVGDMGVYIRRASYKWNGVTLTLNGSIVDVYTYEDNAGWDATFVISGNYVLPQVTGEASKSINWDIQYTLQQM